MEVVGRLDGWFAETLSGLRCQDETRAYVAGLLANFHHASAPDLSTQSVVLALADARLKGDFVAFQRIGDWVLWVDIVHPAFIKHHVDVTEAAGRQAYYCCHRIMMGQWQVYEELADELPRLARAIRCKLGGRRSIFDL